MSITDNEDKASVFGVLVPDLPRGVTAVDAVVLIKGFDTDGEIRHWELRSAGLTYQEAIGMAVTCADSIRNFLINGCGC